MAASFISVYKKKKTRVKFFSVRIVFGCKTLNNPCLFSISDKSVLDTGSGNIPN